MLMGNQPKAVIFHILQVGRSLYHINPRRGQSFQSGKCFLLLLYVIVILGLDSSMELAYLSSWVIGETSGC